MISNDDDDNDYVMKTVFYFQFISAREMTKFANTLSFPSQTETDGDYWQSAKSIVDSSSSSEATEWCMMKDERDPNPQIEILFTTLSKSSTAAGSSDKATLHCKWILALTLIVMLSIVLQ